METEKYRIVSTASNNVLKYKTSSPDYIEENRYETSLPQACPKKFAFHGQTHETAAKPSPASEHLLQQHCKIELR